MKRFLLFAFSCLVSVQAQANVSSFDVVVRDGVVHVLLAEKNTEKSHIHYLSSKDGGKHWSKPMTVTDNTDTLAIRGNDVQLAASGKKLVALWQVKGELPSMGAMVSFYSHDAGKTWHQGKNPAVDNNGDQSHSDLIADKQGVFHSVWLADPEENGYQSLRYARSVDGGLNWQTPTKLDDSTCSCCWNTLAVSPNGALNVLYRDMKPRDMALMQTSDAGQSWQRISTVGEFGWQFDGCPHIGGGLAINEDNALYATVWTGLDNKAGLYTLSSNDNGKTWTEPKALGTVASHSDIAVKKQQVVAIWDDREAEGVGIFIAKSKDGGKTWNTPERLTQTNALATHPRIVATKQGFLALWTEKQKKISTWRFKVINAQ